MQPVYWFSFAVTEVIYRHALCGVDRRRPILILSPTRFCLTLLPLRQCRMEIPPRYDLSSPPAVEFPRRMWHQFVALLLVLVNEDALLQPKANCTSLLHAKEEILCS